MRRLAIIPARCGSKGLKDKNITDLCGKPLIVYSIEAALLSGIFNKILVSTDSEYYADISRQYGADVIMRGEAQSNDEATTFDVLMIFSIDWMRSMITSHYFNRLRLYVMRNM